MTQDALGLRWRPHPRVHALSTFRGGDGGGAGGSAPPFARLNLGRNSGDDPAVVAANRDSLAAAAMLPSPPRWLRQVHGAEVLSLDAAPGDADASA
ncbi:MAG: laccase domain-containing protein, partial [Arenimonas sp.]